MKRLRLGSVQTGFTIVELMIATLVFSVILLVITAGVLSFTKAYFKGLYISATQDTARSVIDTLAQSLQFNGGGVSYALQDPTNPSSPITTYCLGGKQYDFTLNTKQTDVSSSHVFYESKRTSDATCTAKPPTAFDPANGDRDLLATNMRLSDFSLTPPSGTDGLFTVHIRVAYGDDDLLVFPSGHPEQAKCSLDVGSQFCAVADLETTVQKRVK